MQCWSAVTTHIIIYSITYSKGRLKPPLTPLTDGQWPPAVGLPLSASTWELAREVEASLNSAHGRTVAIDSGTSPIQIWFFFCFLGMMVTLVTSQNWPSKIKKKEKEKKSLILLLDGIHGLKNQSGKCEGLGGGDQQGKEPEWEMCRIGRGGSTG
jgi:hypothetical protein